MHALERKAMQSTDIHCDGVVPMALSDLRCLLAHGNATCSSRFRPGWTFNQGVVGSSPTGLAKENIVRPGDSLSTASTPPARQRKVSPMCPVRNVTHVSGRSSPRRRSPGEAVGEASAPQSMKT